MSASPAPLSLLRRNVTIVRSWRTDQAMEILMKVFLVLAAFSVSACTQSIYDFPVATMIDSQPGYSMTGYVKASDEAVARQKVVQRFSGVCPRGAEIVNFKADRADNSVGVKIIRYEALVQCVSS